jgi:hypothetical protein
MKTCIEPNCTNLVFSHGVCKYHYHWQSKNNNIKTKPRIKIVKNIRQIELFKQVWNTRPHISELSGVSLEKWENTPYFYWMFAHVLDKKNYPLFKTNEENIMLVEPFDEHRLLDQGTFDQRTDYNDKSQFKANWDLFFQKKEYLKVKYQEFLNQIL